MRRSARRTRPGPNHIHVEAVERRTLMAAVVVTTGANDGPGSLRAAIDRADTDPSVSAIHVAPSVRTVRIDESLVYSGEQDLSISGRAVVRPTSGAEGDFDLLVADGGADLALSGLTFQGGANGVVVNVPADATGTVEVDLRRVSILDNNLFGLHLNDKANNSAASVRLTVVGSRVEGNGEGESDRDGIRVDEGGAGGIEASIAASRLDENGAEGIELDEGGEGGVTLRVTGSTFNDNGFIDPADLDDGIDVDEADAGDVRVAIFASEVIGNFDEGIDLNESGDGDLRLNAVGVRVNDSGDEGIALEELDAGNLKASLVAVQARRNGADGVLAEEGGAGNLDVSLLASSIVNNDGFGVSVVQEEPGTGRLRVRGTRLGGNADAPTSAEGATVA